ncbi:MAG TPA: hypothetical protein VIR81_05425 [Myxococcales bacterium]
MVQMTSGQAIASPMPPGPRELRPRPVRERRPQRAKLALAHGAYLVAAGLWPVLHLRSFARVTGPKPEGWLTKGVGVCWANLGAALMAAGARGKVAQELRLAAASTALSFAAMGFWAAGSRRPISPARLVDGLLELGFAAAWTASELRERTALGRPPEAAFA